ncbi:S1 family peptidase [Streptosporangium longisporum]|uniref:Alpha-lytic protease prodomain-containing protein n=1 Tax=Streptosporangium longisporum TaxID=46187 RepID=A0ABP6L915_9ACTN
MSRSRTVTTGYVLAIVTLIATAVPAAAPPRATDAPPPAPSPGASPSVPPGKSPPTMFEALQRDLRLSAEQVRTRLSNEVRLAPVEERLRKSLGDRFGGSWFIGVTARKLVVATTNAADIPLIIAAGAQAEVVATPLTRLQAVKRRLDQTLPARSAGGRVRYVDVRSNKVVVLSGRAAMTENVIKGIGVDTAEVRVVASAETPRPLYDLRGGDAYHLVPKGRCSVGFSVAKGTEKGFVTSGHCGRKGDRTTGFNRTSQGVFKESTFPVGDYAWVAVNDDWTPKGVVGDGTVGSGGPPPATPVADTPPTPPAALPAPTALPTPTALSGHAAEADSAIRAVTDATTGAITALNGTRAVIEGASVCRSGSTTGWHCGTIQQRDASAVYPSGKIFGLVRTNVCAERGDSGGPFVSIDQAQGVTSGGAGDCEVGGVTYFQPVEKILTSYGLSLLTVSATGVAR